MSIFLFFAIACLIFIGMTIIGCVSMNIKSKKQLKAMSFVCNDVDNANVDFASVAHKYPNSYKATGQIY